MRWPYARCIKSHCVHYVNTFVSTIWLVNYVSVLEFTLWKNTIKISIKLHMFCHLHKRGTFLRLCVYVYRIVHNTNYFYVAAMVTESFPGRHIAFCIPTTSLFLVYYGRLFRIQSLSISANQFIWKKENYKIFRVVILSSRWLYLHLACLDFAVFASSLGAVVNEECYSCLLYTSPELLM